MAQRLKMTSEEFATEWLHTFCRHNGEVVLAAAIFDSTPAAIERRLYRMQAEGYDLKFVTSQSYRCSS